MIKLKTLLENQILVPRRSKEERQKNHIIATQRKIQQYIKDGGQGDLNLNDTPIQSLPNNLEVKGGLNLSNTPLSEKYTKEEIRKIIEDKGGFIEGDIYM